MHQASAQIGVATANELPQISLTGSIGNTGSPAGNLLNPGVGIWSIGGSLAQKTVRRRNLAAPAPRRSRGL